MIADLKVLLEGLALPEGPRWRDGKLYFSDMFAGEVVSVDLLGERETIATVPNRPSGLGWDRDGTLLVVSMLDQKLLACGAASTVEVADLSGLTTDRCNDMVVDPRGWLYVGDYPLAAGATPSERHRNAPGANLVLVDLRDGLARARARVAATDLLVPNGCVITPDGSTLIVAESAAHRLTAFAIGPNGDLQDRRVWAQLPVAPDGICLDAEGCVWVASPMPPSAVVLVREGGELVERLEITDLSAFACALGGKSGDTLFLMESRMPPGDERVGRVRLTQVAVGAARESYVA